VDFDSLVASMDDTCVATFQKVDPATGYPFLVTIHYSDKLTPDETLPCIVKNPVMEEDYTPGSQPGTRMLILFIPASAGVVALLGNTATFNGVDYDILQSDADRCGSIHIRMRARTQPWNQ
jgi:hypothetical protein